MNTLFNLGQLLITAIYEYLREVQNKTEQENSIIQLTAVTESLSGYRILIVHKTLQQNILRYSPHNQRNN